MGQNPTAPKVILPLICLIGCTSTPPPDTLYSKGREALTRKNYREAVDAFQSLIKHYQKNELYPDAVFRTAESYYGAGDWKNAYYYYELSLDVLTDESKRREAVRRMFEIASGFTEGRREPSSILPFLRLTSRRFGVERLRLLCRRYPAYPEAQKAMLIVGRYYLDEGDYDEALDWLDKILVEKPDEETVASAIFFKGEALMKSCKGVDYDIALLERACRYFVEYLHRAPTGAYRKNALRYISVVNEALAERELRIALFYIREEKRGSAEIHLRYILQEYPKTEAARKAKEYLTELGR